MGESSSPSKWLATVLGGTAAAVVAAYVLYLFPPERSFDRSVVLAFETQEKEPFGGNSISFSAELLRLLGDKYSRFTVGLSGIEVRN